MTDEWWIQNSKFFNAIERQVFYPVVEVREKEWIFDFL